MQRKWLRVVLLIAPLLALTFATTNAGLYHYQQPQQQLKQLQSHSPNQAPASNSDLFHDSSPQQGPGPTEAPSNLNLNPNQNQNQVQPHPQAPASAQANNINQRNSDPPNGSPLFRFRVEPLNSTAVKLVWNLMNGYHADFFEIYYGPIEAGNMFNIKRINGTARDFLITQLIPDTTYRFELIGFQVDERGQEVPFKPPQLLVFTTPKLAQLNNPNGNGNLNRQAETPSAATPTGLRAEAKSNSSILLSWSEPEKPTDLTNFKLVNVIRYYINPINSNNEPANKKYHHLNTTTLSNQSNNREGKVIVQKLEPGTEYVFAIKSIYYSPDMKKILRQSGFSMEVVARTLINLEPPSPPRNFNIEPQWVFNKTSQQDDLRLEFSWLPPDFPNGQLKGYMILYTVDRDWADDKWSRIEIREPVNTWFVTNLKPIYNYYFKIKALNQKGYSADSDIRLFPAPAMNSMGRPDQDKGLIDATGIPQTIPANNKLLLIIICMVTILFILFLLVSKLACCTSGNNNRRKRKSSLNNNGKSSGNGIVASGGTSQAKLNGFATQNSSSTVTARVGTLARRRENAVISSNNSKQQDFWISAMDQPPEVKSNMSSEKSNNDLNMAMVSIQRDSPHQSFATTTQLAPALPDYRFAIGDHQNAALLQQIQPQPQSHYHPGQFSLLNSQLAYDQMDNATASALMTLSKRQQQQMQKYQIQFAATTGNTGAPNFTNQTQAPSPHQQPPPPPPLNIEQQQQQQSLYGTNNNNLANTRSLRLHRPTVYDPVSGSFVQSIIESGPPNYNSHIHPTSATMTTSMNNSQFLNSQASNTLQFHPHQSSTLLSRRSTNTLRSFQNSGLNNHQTYGVLNSFNQPPPPPSITGLTATNNQQQQQQQQPQQILQSHQAVINQLNNSTYPSLPLKHVSAVRPQIMSSLEDQIEMELAEKQAEQQQSQQQLSQDQQQQQQQQQQ